MSWLHDVDGSYQSHRFATSSFRHVVVSPRRRCVVSSIRSVIVACRLRRPSSPSYSLTVVVCRERKTTRNDDIESPFLVWLPRRRDVAPGSNVSK
jgi:hypothetical protein